MLPRPPSASAGFTFVELIAVMIIGGILAAVATTTFMRSGFDAAALAERTQVSLSYAQKVAIAARRAVRVNVTGNVLTLAVCANAMATGTVCPTTWTDLPIPSGEANLAASSSVSLTSLGTFYFDPVGRPVDATGTAVVAQTVTATGHSTHIVTVEAETGYVRR
jgi:MSHA pilin protein MshC